LESDETRLCEKRNRLALFQFSPLFKTGIYTNDWGNAEKYDIKGIE